MLEIYVGSLLEYASDRAVLERAFDVVTKQDVDAILLANLSVHSHQIDLIVALAGRLIVIEAKGYPTAVRGSENGDWQIRLASGWKNVRNPYLQALAAKFALRDAMRAFAQQDVDYPSGAVICVPSIPRGSEVFSGDHKVKIYGLDRLAELLTPGGNRGWDFDTWRAFARCHHLRQVPSLRSASDARLSNAEELVSSYVSSFQTTYTAKENIVEYECESARIPYTSTEVIERGASGANLVLRGPSGCGKTMVATQIGIEAIKKHRVPIFVQAKHFTGNFREALDSEIALLGTPSARTLFSASRRLNRQLVLIVDGLNECSPTERLRLLRGVAAISRRYEASVIATTQFTFEAGILNLEEIGVLKPSGLTKELIARQASANLPLDDSLRLLLDSIESGLEARLVGEIGSEIGPDSSRHLLFQNYARKRLQDFATEGIRALSALAQFLSQHVRFSITRREAERICDQSNISMTVLSCLYSCNLLTLRGERTTFAHELFFNVFAAEAILRRATTVDDLLFALRLPINAERTTFIIGAVDDEALLSSALDATDNEQLIQSTLTGQCGASARALSENRCKGLILRMKADVSQLQFEISDSGFFGVKPVARIGQEWTAPELATLRACATTAPQTSFLDSILFHIRALDQRLEEELARLQPVSKMNNYNLMSGLFANTYLVTNYSPFGTVSSALHNRYSRESNELRRLTALRYLDDPCSSNGQLYISLAVIRDVLEPNESLADRLLPIFRRVWDTAPYHLQLELLEAAQSCGSASAEQRAALISVIESLEVKNIGVSSLLVDALSSLGALASAEREHEASVKEEIKCILSDVNSADAHSAAYAVWGAQFDHPYSSAYYEVLSNLPPTEKKTLLSMAAEGAGEYASSLPILITDLTAYDDPAMGHLIARWVALPPTKAVAPYEEVEKFAMSHVCLARLGCALPDSLAFYDSDAAEALAAAGRVLYWMNRIDISPLQRRHECEAPLNVLLRHDRGVAAGVLCELGSVSSLAREALFAKKALRNASISINDWFPSEVLEICRNCLQHPELQRSYFPFSEPRTTRAFAVKTIGAIGSVVDLPFLRAFADQRDIGTDVIGAVKRLEDSTNA